MKKRKPRSAAQKAATARMVAAMRAKRAKKAAPPKPRKKPRSAAQRAATARMVAANKPSPPQTKPKRTTTPTAKPSATDRRFFKT